MDARGGERSAGGKRGWIALARVALPLAIASAAVLAIAPFARRGAAGEARAEGVPVRRGPLRIAAVASGHLAAAETVRMASGIEGRTTILSIVPEGTEVREGDVVCELDATAMVEQRIQQRITLGNAEAALVKARQTLEIQRSQNASDVDKARQTLEFAAQDQQVFLEGERALELEKAQQAIDLASEEAQRTRGRLAWSEKLSARGFLTATELEADRIAVHRAEVELRQATAERDLLERYRLPRREAELAAALVEARQESQRVSLQAEARLVDFESDVRTCEATLELEREKLARLEAQIERARIRAPRDGYVVYAQRDSDEPPIQAGAEVREREEILSIPSSGGMVANVKLHESVLQQVRVGQACRVTVDALQGALVDGSVAFVAMLPDQNSRWSNPNLRVYQTTIAIASAHPGLRPGMSCSIEILIDELADALHVPLQAVFREGDESVCYLAAGGERRAVRVGRFNDLWVQILAGVEEGERVLLTPPPDAGGVAREPRD